MTSWWQKQTPEKKNSIYQKRKAYRDRTPDLQKTYSIRHRFSRWAMSHNSQVYKRYPAVIESSDITDQELKVWLERNIDNACVYCGGPSNSIDHKTPLSVGGLHRFDNIQMICLTCNRAKNNFTHEQFLQWIRNLVELNLKGNLM